MNKYPLIGVSICAVVLLVLGSLSNVVGYQTAQSSNQQVMNEEVNQKELLFQTIIDIANNKEIQRIILKSQISRGIFPSPDVRFFESNTPILNKNQLKQMYVIGLILSKVISKSRMHSLVQQYQLINPEIQQEISAVFEKDATLKSKMTQLFSSSCDCKNENTTFSNFLVLCLILSPIALYLLVSWFFLAGMYYGVLPLLEQFLGITFDGIFSKLMLNVVLPLLDALVGIILGIGWILNCFWAP
jgi:hypothetical protein